MMTDLTDQEKCFIALAIQGLCMRQGPTVFGLAVATAKKLDIEELLQGYLKDWIGYTQQSPNVGGTALAAIVEQVRLAGAEAQPGEGDQ